MVAAVDDSVGALLDKLEELKLDDKYGGDFFQRQRRPQHAWPRRPGCNVPLRAGKGRLYEGGIREPTLIRAPGITRPGSVSHKPMISMDFFPTMLDLADFLQPKLHVDGRSLLSQLKGNDTGQRTLHWHYPHYHGSSQKPGASIRDGDFEAHRVLPLQQF